ncbi:MAG: GAF and ANTAR domain-containing protein [Elusimicrobia bacterium]|nr:GAF and ANTAR domain-containing protein [Elusimicrobiota bacterium]
MANSRVTVKGLQTFLRQKDKEIELLHRVSEIIGSTWELDRILTQVVGLVTEVTKADGCFLYVHEPSSSELVLRASKNPHPQEIGRIRLKLGEGVTGWVATHKEPVAIFKNASDDTRFKFFHNLPEDRYESFLSAPILMKEEVTGVINVHHKKARRHLEREINLLATIGRLIGGAIENARLHEDAQQKGKRIQRLEDDLETRKLVERAKGILMETESLSEAEAFRRIQSQSMALRKSMKEIAQAILIAQEVASSFPTKPTPKN